MKLFLSLLIPVILLSSCTLDWGNEKDALIASLTTTISEQNETINSLQTIKYNEPGRNASWALVYSDDLIQFESFYSEPVNIIWVWNDSINKRGLVKEIMILTYSEELKTYVAWNSIEVFKKSVDVNPEEYVASIIDATWGNSKNCSIMWATGTITAGSPGIYTIELKDEEIVYTPQELEKIKESDDIAKKDGWPFNGEWMKREILNEHTILTCSHYADKWPNGTSKSYPATIEYNWKNTFVFIPAGADPLFVKYWTLQFKE